ncbi:MAG: hypothetical protein FWD44_10220 [Oscillospiraceae bacterium]|nr:hypothetical protein [Oscillospiraceae bacterium]
MLKFVDNTHYVDTDLILTNPADKIQRPKVQKYIGKFYDVDEVNALFGVIQDSLIKLPLGKIRELIRELGV